MFSRSLRRLTGLLGLAACLLLATPPSVGQITTEAQLKAAYLVNFMKYIEWPGMFMYIC